VGLFAGDVGQRFLALGNAPGVVDVGVGPQRFRQQRACFRQPALNGQRGAKPPCRPCHRPRIVEFTEVPQARPKQFGRAVPQGFEIQAGDDLLCAQAVVLATGACNQPAIPGTADAVPPSITMLTPLTYRDPGLLPDGGVLVVGASVRFTGRGAR
jgi:hypothetical protein